MKKLNVLFLFVAFTFLSLKMHAVITVAAIPSVSVPNNPAVVLRPQNSGATSTTVNIGVTNYTVEANCWDIGTGGIAANGFSWRVYTPTLTYLNPAGANGDFIMLANAVDIDVSLIRELGVARLVVAYYNTLTLNYVYQIYTLNAAGVFVLSAGPTNIVASPSFGAINVDASADYGFAITCDRPGSGIFTLTGLLNPTLTLSATRLMNASTTFIRPDVTIQRYNGNLRIYWVYTNTTQNNIIKSDMDFFTFHTGVGVYVPGGINIYVTPAGFRAQFPRIDAPDAFATNNQRWAWVCEVRSATLSSIVSRYNDLVINTATISALGATSLSSATTINSKPIVTWNNNTLIPRIIYAWHTTQAGIVGLSNPLGFYVSANLNTSTNNLAPGTDYLSVSTTPTLTSPTPTLSFSCNNNLPNLFTTYAVLFGGSPYQMRVKNGPWGGPLYKTEMETENTVEDLTEVTNSTMVYPSLTTDNITYEIAQATENTQIIILDLNGKIVLEKSINNNKGELDLSSFNNGMYIVNIMQNGEVTKSIKINKN